MNCMVCNAKRIGINGDENHGFLCEDGHLECLNCATVHRGRCGLCRNRASPTSIYTASAPPLPNIPESEAEDTTKQENMDAPLDQAENPLPAVVPVNAGTRAIIFDFPYICPAYQNTENPPAESVTILYPPSKPILLTESSNRTSVECCSVYFEAMLSNGRLCNISLPKDQTNDLDMKNFKGEQEKPTPTKVFSIDTNDSVWSHSNDHNTSAKSIYTSPNKSAQNQNIDKCMQNVLGKIHEEPPVENRRRVAFAENIAEKPIPILRPTSRYNDPQQSAQAEPVKAPPPPPCPPPVPAKPVKPRDMPPAMREFIQAQPKIERCQQTELRSRNKCIQTESPRAVPDEIRRKHCYGAAPKKTVKVYNNADILKSISHVRRCHYTPFCVDEGTGKRENTKEKPQPPDQSEALSCPLLLAKDSLMASTYKSLKANDRLFEDFRYGPIRCPDQQCDCRRFVGDFVHHLVTEHLELDPKEVVPGTTINFEIDPKRSHRTKYTLHRVFLLKDKINNPSYNKFKTLIPVIVFSSTITYADILNIPVSDLGDNNENIFIVWLAGLTPKDISVDVTLTTWSSGRDWPRCHIANTNKVADVCEKIHPYKYYAEGKCFLVISQHDMDILTKKNTRKLPLQIFFH